MKRKTAFIIGRSAVRALALAGAAVPLVMAGSTQAGTKYYVGGASNYWSSTSSWSTTPPPGNAPQPAPVAGDTVNITNSTGSAQTLTYNVSGGSGISLGPVTIDAFGGSTSTENDTLLMSSNYTLVTGLGSAITVGVNGVGTINQSAGTVNVSGGALYLGNTAVSIGNYLLSGTGNLLVNGSETVGSPGTGFFSQTGSSTNTVSNNLAVGAGSSYSMNGTTSLLTVAGTENVVGNGLGYATFNQYNGTNNVSGPLIVTNGAFTLAAGSLSAGGEVIGTQSSVPLASYGGSFLQTGGSHTVGSIASPNNLIIGNDSVVGSNSYDTGFSYTLNGSNSQLTVNGNEYVGFESLYNGTYVAGRDVFVQNAGTHQITGNLELAYQGQSPGLDSVSGNFNLNGGSLSAGTEYIGDSGAGIFVQQNNSSNTAASVVLANQGTSSGTYQLSGTGSLNVSGGLSVGVQGTGVFNQTGGTVIVGGTLSLESSGGFISSYNLGPSGVLTANAETLSQFGSVQFNQSGGSNTIATGLTLSGGTYTLSGSGSLSAATEQVGLNDTAGFIQQGGTNTVAGLVDLGSGFAGIGTYTMTGASSQLSAGSIIVGDQNTGTFNQTAGTVSVGTLTVGNLYSLQNPFGQTSVGTYLMNGSGSVLTAATEIIGTGGQSGLGGSGTFIQFNGSNTVTTSFSVGSLTAGIGGGGMFYPADSYDIQAGVLNLPNSSTAANNYGQFTVDGGTVNGYLNNPATGLASNTVTLNGGVFAGTLNNSEVVSINNTASFTGTLINTNTVTQSGGTVTGIVLNQGYYYLEAGTFNASNSSVAPVNAASATFYQWGGNIGSATFLNSGYFVYTGGTITGRIINQGTFNIATAGIVFGNGLENDGNLILPNPGSGIVATFNGLGLDNFGSVYLPAAEALAGTIINDYGGTFSGQGTISGTLSNLGTLSPGNGFTVTGLLTNGGIVGPIYAGTQLKATGGLTNTGQIQLYGGQITGGTIINNPGGVLEFEASGEGSSQVSGFSQPVNNSGGVIEIGAQTLVTFASFNAGNNNGGDIQIANNATLTVTTAFPNSGTIELLASSSALNGGSITNTGSITGIGRISNAVLNSGIVEAKAGLLQISAAGSTNLAGAQIIADSSSTVQYSQGLSTNAGTITMYGGTFDNNSRPLINTGLINGSGTFRTGGAGLNNSAGAIIDITAGTSVFGPVSNGGAITSYGSTNTFYGNVTDAVGGTIKVTNGTIYFLGNSGATVGGLYTSDPSDNYFNGLTITPTGTVTGGGGDRFFMLNGTIFSNAGTFNDAGTLSAGVATNSGTFTQTGTLIETGNFTNSGTATIGGSQNWSHGTISTNTAGTATFQSDAGAMAQNLSVNVSGGSVLFSSTQHLAGLNIGGGTVQVNGGGNGHRSMVYTPSLTDTGTLDLTGNDLDVQAGGSTALANVTTLVAHGYNDGTWQGPGITSSSAANDPLHLTAVGVILNAANLTTPLYTTFDNTSVALNDVLVKYTYYGDADLNGRVDGSDYSRVDSGYVSQATGWYNGDFNYDGTVDGSDYTLLDNAFNTQTTQLDATLASPAAVATDQLSGGSAAVPEPATLSLLGIAAAGMLGRRRRK